MGRIRSAEGAATVDNNDNMVPGPKSCFNELIDRQLAFETVPSFVRGLPSFVSYV